MKIFFFVFAFCFFISGDLIANDICTKSGIVYKNVRTEKTVERGLLITHAAGSVLIPYSELPDDLQKKYKNDAERFGSKLQETASSRTSSDAGARKIYTGPRGGRYYINSDGKKIYIRKKK